MKTPQVVYLMHNPDARRCTHKIGYATDAEYRLRHIRNAAPDTVLVGLRDGGRAEELRLHERLSHLHVSGEWFALTDDIAASLGFEPIDAFYAARPHLARGLKACRVCRAQPETVRVARED